MPTISGVARTPGGVPLRGTWTIKIQSSNGVAFDDDGDWRAGIYTQATDVTGECEVTLPATTEDYLYIAHFTSREKFHPGKVSLGWFPFELEADATWQDIIETPTIIPTTPSNVALVRDLADQVADDREATEDARDAAVAVGTTNDTIIKGRIDDVASQTRASLNAAFVSTSGGSGVRVDPTLAHVPGHPWQDFLTIASTGDASITLGAPPLNDKVAVSVKTGSAAPARLLPGAYTVTGQTLAIPGLIAGDKVLIDYLYDADSTPSPASAIIDNYLVFDNFTRADSAITLGNDLTGKTWATTRSSVWGIRSNRAYKATNGSVGGTNDTARINAGASDVTIDVVIGTIVSGGWIGPQGRQVDSNNFWRVGSSGLLKIKAGLTDATYTLSQQPVIGDTIRLKMVGSTLWVYLKRAASGTFTLICGPITDTDFQTATLLGIILSGSVATFGACDLASIAVKAAA